MAKEYLVNLNNYTEGESYFSMPRMRPKTTDERVAKRDDKIEELQKIIIEKDQKVTQCVKKWSEAIKSISSLNQKVWLLEEQNSVLMTKVKELNMELYGNPNGPPPPFNPDAVTVNRDAPFLGPDAEGE
jgi:hypothetical protein